MTTPTTNEQIEEAVRQHQLWICVNDKKGKQFDLKHIENYVFKDKDLNCSDFSNAKLVNCKFNNCSIRYANFSNAKLVNCKFNNCYSSHSDFSNAKLFNCDLFISYKYEIESINWTNIQLIDCKWRSNYPLLNLLVIENYVQRIEQCISIEHLEQRRSHYLKNKIFCCKVD